MSYLPFLNLRISECPEIGVTAIDRTGRQRRQKDPTEFEDEACAFCLDPVGKPLKIYADPEWPNMSTEIKTSVHDKYLVPCYAMYCANGHVYHWSCIARLVNKKRKCPECKFQARDDLLDNFCEDVERMARRYIEEDKDEQDDSKKIAIAFEAQTAMLSGIFGTNGTWKSNEYLLYKIEKDSRDERQKYSIKKFIYDVLQPIHSQSKQLREHTERFETVEEFQQILMDTEFLQDQKLDQRLLATKVCERIHVFLCLFPNIIKAMIKTIGENRKDALFVWYISSALMGIDRQVRQYYITDGIFAPDKRYEKLYEPEYIEAIANFASWAQLNSSTALNYVYWTQLKSFTALKVEVPPLDANTPEMPIVKDLKQKANSIQVLPTAVIRNHTELTQRIFLLVHLAVSFVKTALLGMIESVGFISSKYRAFGQFREPTQSDHVVVSTWARTDALLRVVQSFVDGYFEDIDLSTALEIKNWLEEVWLSLDDIYELYEKEYVEPDETIFNFPLNEWKRVEFVLERAIKTTTVHWPTPAKNVFAVLLKPILDKIVLLDDFTDTWSIKEPRELIFAVVEVFERIDTTVRMIAQFDALKDVKGVYNNFKLDAQFANKMILCLFDAFSTIFDERVVEGQQRQLRLMLDGFFGTDDSYEMPDLRTPIQIIFDKVFERDGSYNTPTLWEEHNYYPIQIKFPQLNDVSSLEKIANPILLQFELAILETMNSSFDLWSDFFHNMLSAMLPQLSFLCRLAVKQDNTQFYYVVVSMWVKTDALLRMITQYENEYDITYNVTNVVNVVKTVLSKLWSFLEDKFKVQGGNHVEVQEDVLESSFFVPSTFLLKLPRLNLPE